MQDMKNMDHSPLFAVINQIFARRKAEDTGRQFIGLSAYERIIAQQGKSLFNIDEPVATSTHVSAVNTNRSNSRSAC